MEQEDNIPQNMSTEEYKNIYEEYKKFYEIYQKESDRGSIIISLSYADYILQELLRKKLIGNEKYLDKEIFNFNGCLGTLSSKINLSYSMGIIPKEIKEELHHLRKIRNELAHSIENLDCNSEKIESHLQKLKFLMDPHSNDCKNKLLSSITIVLAYLRGRLEVETKFKEISFDREKLLNKIQEKKSE